MIQIINNNIMERIISYIFPLVGSLSSIKHNNHLMTRLFRYMVYLSHSTFNWLDLHNSYMNNAIIGPCRPMQPYVKISWIVESVWFKTIKLYLIVDIWHIFRSCNTISTWLSCNQIASLSSKYQEMYKFYGPYTKHVVVAEDSI